MKAIRSNKQISPYGGAIPILKKINECAIPQAIRKCLGLRKKQSRYGYEDIFIAWVLTTLCGGTRLDHITKIKKKLPYVSGLHIPSHDTLGRVMKSLSSEIKIGEAVKREGPELYITKTYYTDDIKLNRMLIMASKRSGALKEGVPYVLDIDATFIYTRCADSMLGLKENSKKQSSGFNPLICLIGGLPVYISMRSCNANSAFQIKECLEQCINLLQEQKITVKKVISDSAGYNVELTDMLHSRNIQFNIHAVVNKTYKSLMTSITEYKKWETVELESANFIRACQVGEVKYKMTGSQNEHRVIMARMPKKNNPKGDEEREEYVNKCLEKLKKKRMLKSNDKIYELGEWREYKGYTYKLIITNDFKKSPLELLREYNKRGDAERKFDFMKNDFAWRWPPFMRLNQNIVFMIAAALANNLFRAIVKQFKEKIPQLNLKSRLADFRYVFVNVACSLTRKTYVFYSTDIEYELLI